MKKAAFYLFATWVLTILPSSALVTITVDSAQDWPIPGKINLRQAVIIALNGLKNLDDPNDYEIRFDTSINGEIHILYSPLEVSLPNEDAYSLSFIGNGAFETIIVPWTNVPEAFLIHDTEDYQVFKGIHFLQLSILGPRAFGYELDLEPGKHQTGIKIAGNHIPPGGELDGDYIYTYFEDLLIAFLDRGIHFAHRIDNKNLFFYDYVRHGINRCSVSYNTQAIRIRSEERERTI